ncbi:MAG: hypothetical protein ACI9H8_000118 [Lysobacterales bacterium]|jgi:hypothetical protein
MNKSIINEDELVTGLHQLSKSIKPGRELWPEIVSRLSPISGREKQLAGRRSWRNEAVAASVVIAFVAGLMSGRQIGNEEHPQPTSQVMDVALQAALEATEREYQAAFREFIPVGSSRVRLETQTVENIENSWVELQQAETALQSALHDYPENSYLNQKLLDLRSQQLGFMKQIAMLDHFSRRKT